MISVVYFTLGSSVCMGARVAEWAAEPVPLQRFNPTVDHSGQLV